MNKIGIGFRYSGISDEEQIAYLEKHGFVATFIPAQLTHFSELLPKLSKSSITCESIHAPWNHINSIWEAGERGEYVLSYLIDRTEVCARFGVPTLVIHVTDLAYTPPISELGNERFDRLMARADELGVVIAVENVRACGHVVYLLERYPQMGFCWDVGHEACFQHGWQSMPMVGSRIAALHLHDNRLMPNGDDHLLPYDGKIDMERVARQLAESGYEKTMMLETAIYRDMDADAYFARAASAASKMAERVDFYRKRVGV